MSELDENGDFTRIWVKTEIKYEPPDPDEINVFAGEDNVEENVLGDDDPMKHLETEVELEVKVESLSEVKDEKPKHRKQNEEEKNEKPSHKKRKKLLNGDRRFHKDRQMKCEYCPYQTGRAQNMSTHMKKHSDGKDLSCRFCDYKTKYANSLKVHETNQHGNGDPNFVKVRKTHKRKFKCPVSGCNYVAAHRHALKTHFATHSKEKPYKCEFCKYSTKFLTALKRHEKTKHKIKNESHLKEKLKELKCESCDYTTSVEKNMKSHVKSHYNDYFICNMCEYETVLENMFKIHMEQHEAEKNEISADDSKENITEAVMKIARNIKTESIPTSTQGTLQPKNETEMATTPKTTELKCPHCDYKSPYRHHYKTHLRKHSNDKEFKCGFCEYETKYPTSLKRHLKTQHTDDKKKKRPTEKVASTKARKRVYSNKILSCPQCDYSSKWRYALLIHIRKHNDEKPFLCDQCDYSTYYSSSLQRHIIKTHTHSDDPNNENHKPHICEICGFRSWFKENLKNHMRKHSVDKQFKCQHCSYATAYRNCMDKHMRMHDRKDRKVAFQCEKCPFYTKFEGKMSLHLVKIHKQQLENGHRCPYCDFSTTIKWRLNMHVQRSRQDEPIKCKYCDFETVYKCEGKIHKMKHFPHDIPHEYVSAKIENNITDNVSKNLEEVVNNSGDNPQGDANLVSLVNEANKIIHQNLNSKMLQNILPSNSKHSAETFAERAQNKATKRKKTADAEFQTGLKNQTNEFRDQLDISTINWDKIPVLKSADSEKPFGCYNCSYTARFKAAVQRHFQRHHGGKTRPYKCSYCDFAGSTRDSLGTHTKKSKLDQVQTCPECDFTSTYKCQLVSHQKIHYKYRCAVCTYSCKQKVTLDAHYLLHQGTALKCKVCDYVTVKKSSLMYHMMKHTGVRPLQCRYCEYSSGRRDLLRNHMRRFHSDLIHNIENQPDIVEPEEKDKNEEQNVIEIDIQNDTPVMDDSDNDYDTAKTEENVSEYFSPNHSEPYDNYAAAFENEEQKIAHQNFEHFLPTYAVVEQPRSNEQTQEKVTEAKANVIENQTYEIPIIESNILNWERIPVRINKKNPEKPFECYNCSYASKFRGSIRKHFQRHHGNKARPYKCPNCDFAGSTKDSISKHTNRGILETAKTCKDCDFSTFYQCQYVMHQKIHYKYRCTMCTYSCVIKSTLEDHHLIHEGGLLKCSYCSFETKSKYYLKCHETQHREGRRKYVCDHCNYSTHTRSIITTHLKKHFERNNESNSSTEKPEKPVANSALKPFKCKYCPYSSSGKVWLRKHMKKFHIDDENATENQSDSSEKPYKCNLCPFASSGIGWLNNHLKIVHNLHDYVIEAQSVPVEKPLKCQYCSYATTGKSWLRNHIRKFHNNEPRIKKPAEKKFKCPYCSYSSTGKGWLKNHVKVVHKIVENDEIPEIQPEFIDQPFKCQYCPYSTTAQIRLQNHIQRFHVEDPSGTEKSESPEKPFKCQYCNYSAAGQAWLQNHIDKYHTAETQSGSIEKCFKCELCPYATSGKAWLENHMKRAHTGEPKRPRSGRENDVPIDGQPPVRRKRGRPRKAKPNEPTVTVITGDSLSQPLSADIPSAHGNHFIYYTMIDPNFVKVRKTHKRKFKCPVSGCNYVAAHRHALKTHFATHSKEKPYKCEFCKYSTKFLTALKRHEKTKHKIKNESHLKEKLKELKCESCDYTTSVEKNMKSHVKSHYNDYFICNMCEYETVLENMFKIHMEQHEAEKNEISADDSKENITEAVMKIARNIKTESIPTSTQETLQPKNETEMATTPKTTELKCPHCDYKSPYRHHYKTHLRKHSNDKEFKCGFCEYETKYPTSLKRHLKTQHTDDKKKKRPTEKVASTKARKRVYSNKILSCPQCDYSSKWRNALLIHIRKHNDEKPFLCDQCDYSTYYSSSLQRHIIQTHTHSDDPNNENHKPHICEICGFRSWFKVNLKNHMRKHSVDKQFKCQHCSYATAYRNCMDKHMRMHDRKDRKVAFQCEKCPFYTKFEGKMSLHLVKIHKQQLENGHRCPYCDFSTTIKWRLNIHVQRSRQDEPIKCKYCDFETVYKCEGKIHKMKHFPHDIPHEYVSAKIENNITDNVSKNLEEVVNNSGDNPQGDANLVSLVNEANKIIHQNLNSKMLQNILPSNSKHSAETFAERAQNKATKRKKTADAEFQTGLKNQTNEFRDQLDISTINWDKIPVLKSADSEKPFGCYNCSYTARFKAAVQRHFQRHHGGKTRPYKCSYCDFAGSTRDSLGTHTKKSKLDQVQTCPECDFTSTYKCQLVSHQKIHYKYRCAVCTYSCKQKVTLDAHYLLHQGTALKCKVCDYVTVKRSSLMYHMMKHTGVRPLQCRYCEYSSGRRDLLRNHMRRFHSDLIHNIENQPDIVEPEEKDKNEEQNVIEIDIQNDTPVMDDSDNDYDTAKTEENVSEYFSPNHSEPYDNYAAAFENEEQKIAHQNFEHFLPTYAVVEQPRSNEQTQEKVTEAKANVIENQTYEIPIIESNILNWERIPVRINKKNPEKPFECYNCSYASKFRGSIRKHFQRHHGNKARPYKCPNCDFAGSTKDSISKHTNRGILETAKTCKDCDFSTFYQCQYVMHQKIHYKYRCTMCTYSCVIKSTLEDHYLIHEGGLLKCSYCSFETKSKYYLKCHETQHREGRRKYVCDHCNYSTHTRSIITTHLKKHFERNNESNSSTEKPEKPVANSALKPFKCKYCPYSSSGKVWLRKHMKKFHIDDENATENQSDSSEKPYKCNLCPFASSGIGWLNNHLKIVHNLHDYVIEAQSVPVEKPLKCQYCSYATTGKSWLRNHIRKFHNNEPRIKKPAEKKFKCPYCSYSSTGKGWLKNHVKVVHKIVENDEIPEIQPEFIDQPFKCQYCPYSTTAQIRLQNHIQRFHVEDPSGTEKSESPEKPFKCQYCNYSAAGQAWLQNHIDKYHTAETQSGSIEKCFKCELCPYATSGKAWLENHMKRAHTGEPKRPRSGRENDVPIDGQPPVRRKRGRPRKAKPNEPTVTVITGDSLSQPLSADIPSAHGNHFIYYTMM